MNKWNNKFRYRVASCWLFILKILQDYGLMGYDEMQFRTEYRKSNERSGKNLQISNKDVSLFLLNRR